LALDADHELEILGGSDTVYTATIAEERMIDCVWSAVMLGGTWIGGRESLYPVDTLYIP
jgi:hypothetical protein